MCDGVDEDCDGVVDDDATDASAWYPDADGDTFGAGPSLLACTEPVGYAAVATDCDDGAATTYPGAPEICSDGVDNDCDGAADPACSPSGALLTTDADLTIRGRFSPGQLGQAVE